MSASGASSSQAACACCAKCYTCITQSCCCDVLSGLVSGTALSFSKSLCCCLYKRVRAKWARFDELAVSLLRDEPMLGTNEKLQK